MFHHRAVPYLQALSEGGHRLPHSEAVRHRRIRHGGPASGRDERHVQPHPGSLRQGGECELRVTAKAPTQEEAQALLLPKVEELKARFGALVYGVDVPPWSMWCWRV